MGGGRVFWIITGAGGYLRELAEEMGSLRRKHGISFTLGFSRWGYEVARIYGVIPRLRVVAGGGYMEEWLIGDEGYYYVGRLNLGKYDALVIAPATGNTIAKIAHGIADSLPSLAYAEAGKSGVPIIILPTDLPGPDGYAESEAPCIIDRRLCRCMEELGYCPALKACPADAIRIVDGKPRIDHKDCIGCGVCMDKCIAGAVKCWEKIRIKPRPLDIENIEEIRGHEGTFIIRTPGELRDKLLEILGVRR